MRYILYFLLLISVSSCNMIQGLFGQRTNTKPVFVPISAHGFEHDSLQAARLGLGLLQVDSLYAIPVYPKNSGKIKIKNSFNTTVKDKSEVVVKDKSQVKAKGEGQIGEGNTNQESKGPLVVGDNNKVDDSDSRGIPPLLLYLVILLVVVYLFYPRLKKVFPFLP